MREEELKYIHTRLSWIMVLVTLSSLANWIRYEKLHTSTTAALQECRVASAAARPR